MQMKVVSLEEIERTTNLLPYDRSDLAVMKEWTSRAREAGRDICLSRDAADDIGTAELMETGFLILHSDALDTEFVFAKADAGKSFLGRQKAVYSSFVGQYAADEWIVGTAFKSLVQALASIGNLYRAEGLE